MATDVLGNQTGAPGPGPAPMVSAPPMAAPVAPPPPAIFAQNPTLPPPKPDQQTQEINQALQQQNAQSSANQAKAQGAGNIIAGTAAKAASFIPVVGPFISAGISAGDIASNAALAAGKQGPTQELSGDPAQQQAAAEKIAQTAQNKRDDDVEAVKNAVAGGAALGTSFIPIVGPFISGGIAIANQLTNKKKYGGLL